MISDKEIKKLILLAKDIRKDIITMSYHAGSAHSGGALSCVEILVALYFKIMKVFPEDPYNDKRDRLIFSKGHDAKVLYATLCERGFFPKSVLEGYEKDGGKLHGHNVRHFVPGVENSAGSLGHGLSLAAGVAFAGKIDKKKFKVYAILSDGECDEGSIWEAIFFAGHHKLDNLVVIVDYNKLQGFGYTKDILDFEPFTDKWKAFGWEAKEIDGHDIEQLIGTLSKVPLQKGKPTVLIAHTIKGLGGVEKHINQISSQYKPPTEEEYKIIMEESEEI